LSGEEGLAQHEKSAGEERAVWVLVASDEREGRRAESDRLEGTRLDFPPRRRTGNTV
jgi:hypothetical protein